MRFQENQHFSHQHILIPLQLSNQSAKMYCKACEEEILEEHYHGCFKCQHWLHEGCLDFPRSIEHPSHPSHPLTLIPKPTYSCRAYSCNACGSDGNSFSMSCAHCEFDLHLNCASLPSSLVLDHGQHPHKLKLLFRVPSSSNNHDKNTAVTFMCDFCHSVMNKNHWLYYCAGCDFALHLDCAIPKKGSRQGEDGVGGSGSGNHRESKAPGMSGKGNEYRNQWENLTSQAEQIRMVSEAQDELCAAQMKAMIEARSRQAMLDQVDPPRRYHYYY